MSSLLGRSGLLSVCTGMEGEVESCGGGLETKDVSRVVNCDNCRDICGGCDCGLSFVRSGGKREDGVGGTGLAS
jgi:hypothetical protein